MSRVSNNLQVLIAEQNEYDRDHLAGLLYMNGYEVVTAADGGAAARIADTRNIDIAIVDQAMQPKTGFDFARHCQVKGHTFGIIMITDEPSTDLLLEISRYEIKQVLRKPVEPNRLVEVVRRVLRSHGKNPDAIGAHRVERGYSPDQLMARAIALAHQNARSRLGGPFGAVVADADGHIIGEGVNSVTSRCDPTAHAEVLAIRRATEKLGRTELKGCTLYCSSEPTMLGQALVIRAGIEKVCYALTHAEIAAMMGGDDEDRIKGEVAKPIAQRSVAYEQLQHDQAQDMVRMWQGLSGKVAD